MRLPQVGTDPKDILPLLKQQLTSAVLWDTSCKNMISSGVTEFYEAAIDSATLSCSFDVRIVLGRLHKQTDLLGIVLYRNVKIGPM